MTSHDVVVPDVGEGGMDVLFVQWFVADGDYVNEGEDLFELDTAKTNISVQAIRSGYIYGLAASPGDELARGQVIAHIGDTAHEPRDDGAESPSQSDAQGASSLLKTQPGPIAVEGDRREPNPSPNAHPQDFTGAPVTPKAKQLAKELQVDLGAFGGSGWVTSLKVMELGVARHEAVASPTRLGSGNTSSIQATRKRSAVSSAMATWLQVPHASLSASLPIDVNSHSDGLVSLVSAVSTALRLLPETNFRWDGRDLVHVQPEGIGLAWEKDGTVIRTRIGIGEQSAPSYFSAIEEAKSRAFRGVVSPEDYLERSLTVLWLESQFSMSGFSVLPQEDSLLLVAINSPGMVSLTLTFDFRCLSLYGANRFLSKVVSEMEGNQ